MGDGFDEGIMTFSLHLMTKSMSLSSRKVLLQFTLDIFIFEKMVSFNNVHLLVCFCKNIKFQFYSDLDVPDFIILSSRPKVNHFKQEHMNYIHTQTHIHTHNQLQ